MTTPARGRKPRVLSGLTPRFPDEVRLYVMIGDFDMKDLEVRIARVESFQSDQEKRKVSAQALAVAHASGGRTGAGGRARGRGRHGRRFTKRHDDGQGRKQQ